ncbi:MAG: type II secretion system F family protein [Thermoplasmata archaeon]|nr:type II secretion system F family protein [Thermoplasmata archaeon]
MIGKRITWISFILMFLFISTSIILRIKEYYGLSNVVLASSIVLFLVLSWIQRKIKEDMLVFVTEELKEREWRYYLSSLFSFIFITFTTFLTIFIIFFGLPLPRALIDVLLGIVLILMLYTIFSVPTVEKNYSYYILFLLAFLFSLIVIGSQLDLYHLPNGLPSFIKKMGDPLFLINMAILLWMGSLISGGEMPSPIGSIIGIYERGKAVKEEIVFRRNILYATIIAFIVIFIFVNLIAAIGLPKFSIGYMQWQYAIIFASIGLLITLIIYILFIMPEKTSKLKEKYNIEKIYKIIILSTSVAFATLFIVLSLMVQWKMMTSIGSIRLSSRNSIDFAIFGILVLIGPFGFYEYSRYRKVDAMEDRFPEFLRDLAESRKAGMTMAQAVESAARGDYGYLTPEIKKMAVQISWGVPFSKALEQFGERINTPLVKRTTAMVVKASESGGKVADVIEAAAKNVREIKILQAERKTEMKMYLMIIYVTFFVFLAVIAVLAGMFLPKLITATQSTGGLGGIGLGGGSGNVEEYKFIYVCTALSQAIGNGIVAGALSEGKIIAGLRHATLMIIVTYLAFKLIF